MRLFTGDECGLLKECIPELSRKKDDRETAVAPNGAMPHVSLGAFCRIDPEEFQARDRGVVDMAFVNQRALDDDVDTDGGTSFSVLRQNGSVELWEGSADSTKHSGNYDKVYTTKNLFKDVTDSTSKQKPIGLGAFPQQAKLCVGDSLGNLSILNLESGKVVETYNAHATSKRGSTISYTPGNNENTQLATAMACDPVSGRVGVGGRERETTLLDLATGKVVFKAKNLPPDPQTLLQQPVWPTSILFLQDGNTMAVGTAYKEVRLYDVREASRTRRPTATTPEGLLEYRVTCLCQVQEYELVIGDAAGYIYNVDLRKLGRNPKMAPNKNLGRYIGPAGSVRQLKKHPTLPRLAAVGLDRMLRIYDTNTRKQLDCIYMKQRLNCVLFDRDDTWGKGYEGADGDDNSDIDQDDVVQDYIDSSDEERNGFGGDKTHHQSDDESHHEEQSDDQDSDGGDNVSDDDSSSENEEVDPEEVHSESEADSEDKSPNVDAKINNNDSEDTDEEEIVIKAPKKRRRR